MFSYWDTHMWNARKIAKRSLGEKKVIVWTDHPAIDEINFRDTWRRHRIQVNLSNIEFRNKRDFRKEVIEPCKD